MRELRVLHLGHELLHVALRAVQLATHGGPIAGLAQLRQTGAVANHAVADAKCLRLAQEHAAEIIDAIFAFSRNDQKSVCDQASENEAELFARTGEGLRKIAFELLVRQRL